MSVLRMNGVRVQNLEEFRKNFDFANARDYLYQGRLSIWMREIGECNIADKLDELKQCNYSDRTLMDNFKGVFDLPEAVCRDIFSETDSSGETDMENIPLEISREDSFMEKLKVLPELSEERADKIKEKITEILNDTAETEIDKLLEVLHIPVAQGVRSWYRDTLSPAEKKQMERLCFIISQFTEQNKQKKNRSAGVDVSSLVNSIAVLAKHSGAGENADKFRSYEITADSHLKTDLGFTKEQQEVRLQRIRSRYHVKLDDLSDDPTIEEVCLAVENDLYGRHEENHALTPLSDEIQEQIKAELKRLNTIQSLCSSDEGRSGRLSYVLRRVYDKLPEGGSVFSVFSDLTKEFSGRVDLHKKLRSEYGLLAEQLYKILHDIRDEYNVELLGLSADPTTEEIALELETELAQ